MKMKDKHSVEAGRLLGEFIGTLKGICLWEIPEELKKKLQAKLIELRKVEGSLDSLVTESSVCEICGGTKDGIVCGKCYERLMNDDPL